MRDDVGRDNRDLIGFVRSLANPLGDLVEEDFGAGFYRLRTSEAEKRQAQHDIRTVEDALLELLRNARDAGATSVAVASQLRKDRFRELVVIDNGEGIPPTHHELVFEPRVTSRVRGYVEDDYGVHGRGMALYAIRARAAHARVAFSAVGGGTAVSVTFDLDELPERKNQAERPRVVRDERGYEVRGVRNIAYVLTDFALRNPSMTVLVGTHAETLRGILVEPEFAAMTRRLGVEPGRDRYSYNEVSTLAASLGLSISPRNLYRVASGDVPEPQAVVGARVRTLRVDVGRYASLRFTAEDWDEVRRRIEADLQPFLERYGLEVVEMRQVRGKGELRIQVRLAEQPDAF